MPSGGYRQPSKPAAVSGPGALSQRTDKGQPIRDISGGDYGDASEFRSLQQAAPVASAPSMSGGGGGAAPAGPPTPGMGDPTQMPGVPVTAGAALGAGPGPAAAGITQGYTESVRKDTEYLKQYLPAMLSVAMSDDASPSFKSFVRQYLTNL